MGKIFTSKRTPLNIKNDPIAKRLITLLVIVAAIYLLSLRIDEFNRWNLRIHDSLLRMRGQVTHLIQPYHPAIVHIDLDDSSIAALGTPFLNRSHYGQLAENLFSMTVASQLYDFIFTAPSAPVHDRRLADALSGSNSFLGMAFDMRIKTGLNQESLSQSHDLGHSDWTIPAEPKHHTIPEGFTMILPLAALMEAAKGLGSINVSPDHDGIFRRLPLFIRHQDKLYPSLSLRVVCDFLGVAPQNVEVNPGRSVILDQAQFPGSNRPQKIVIPVDHHANMIINFLGPWGSMTHYGFSDIYFASEDSDLLAIWQEELKGAIAIVSDVSTGSSDTGSIPLDQAYPLSGLYGNAINTILTGSFIRDYVPISRPVALCLLPLLMLLFSLQHSIARSTAYSLLALLSYLALVISLALFWSLQLALITPLFAAVISFISCQVIRAREQARELAASELKRNLFEKELEIGRQIQSDFFPATIPQIPGWDLAAHFKPARQVAGDFYDAFILPQNRLVLIIADVCDKGVGAALFMALIRSLVRSAIFQQQAANPPEILADTARQSSDYIALNHAETNMFATIFLAILDSSDNRLHYVNCGHEPPAIFNPDGARQDLNPTGPAIGLMAGMEFRPESIQFNKSDLFFGYTDGITDTLNSSGANFGKAFLENMTHTRNKRAAQIIEDLDHQLQTFMGDTPPFDDITMLCLKGEMQAMTTDS
ncbi:MAG: CHASE2 domain-containing protein [Desulfobulbaceae bacterium]|nr:MAG: CHASE2 domain-containing protein [Desulfobulbaceae bacterium]